MTKPSDLTGQTFGRWTVLERSLICGRHGKALWECHCQCGARRVVLGASLRNGKSQSCGCWRDEKTAVRATKHGHTKAGQRTQEFAIWCEVIKRCTDPQFKRWADYGGRGITVCERWRDFAAFFADMGLRPSRRHSIDRRDNSRGYEPSNCHWATDVEQARNTRRNRYITFNGQTKCVAEWAAITGISGPTIHFRLRQGWPIERTLTKPGYGNRRDTHACPLPDQGTPVPKSRTTP